jgi:hypothetical protein
MAEMEVYRPWLKLRVPGDSTSTDILPKQAPERRELEEGEETEPEVHGHDLMS